MAVKRLLKSHNAAENGEKQLGSVSSVSEEKDTEMAKTKFLNCSFPGSSGARTLAASTHIF